MLFLLCANHSVPNFYFRTSALKPYSTIKHIGVIDLNNVIKDEDVIYRDIQSADGRIRLPTVGTGDEETTVSFAPEGVGASEVCARQRPIRRSALPARQTAGAGR
ncbi:hypothetical protein G6F31_020633 [Rhizopus arrhizus]|nr:hypothetical protein G6F31_020633 [Rhizopus arrhizus]